MKTKSADGKPAGFHGLKSHNFRLSSISPNRQDNKIKAEKNRGDFLAPWTRCVGGGTRQGLIADYQATSAQNAVISDASPELEAKGKPAHQ